MSYTIEEIRRDFEEMIDQFEELLNSGKLQTQGINGFIFALSLSAFPEDKIGANVSLSLLERSEEDRANILSMIGQKLKVDPDYYIDHLQRSKHGALDFLRRWRS